MMWMLAMGIVCHRNRHQIASAVLEEGHPVCSLLVKVRIDVLIQVYILLFEKALAGS